MGKTYNVFNNIRTGHIIADSISLDAHESHPKIYDVVNGVNVTRVYIADHFKTAPAASLPAASSANDGYYFQRTTDNKLFYGKDGVWEEVAVKDGYRFFLLNTSSGSIYKVGILNGLEDPALAQAINANEDTIVLSNKEKTAYSIRVAAGGDTTFNNMPVAKSGTIPEGSYAGIRKTVAGRNDIHLYRLSADGFSEKSFALEKYDSATLISLGGSSIQSELLDNPAQSTLPLNAASAASDNKNNLRLSDSISTNISGNVTGNVNGNVTGNLTGNVKGDIKADNGTTVLQNGSNGTNATFTGTVTGDVIGDLTGNVDGIVGGNTPAAVTGTIITANTNFAGNLTGNVTGNLTGNVTGDLTGDVTGDITGTVTNNVTDLNTGNATTDGKSTVNKTSKKNMVKYEATIDLNGLKHAGDADDISGFEGANAAGEVLKLPANFILEGIEVQTTEAAVGFTAGTDVKVVLHTASLAENAAGGTEITADHEITSVATSAQKTAIADANKLDKRFVFLQLNDANNNDGTDGTLKITFYGRDPFNF